MRKHGTLGSRKKKVESHLFMELSPYVIILNPPEWKMNVSVIVLIWLDLTDKLVIFANCQLRQVAENRMWSIASVWAQAIQPETHCDKRVMHV